MASISKRPIKNSMAYRIQVKIKDKGSGEIKVRSTTWKPPVGLTPKQIEREVVVFTNEYEKAVKAAETAAGEPTQSAVYQRIRQQYPPRHDKYMDEEGL